MAGRRRGGAFLTPLIPALPSAFLGYPPAQAARTHQNPPQLGFLVPGPSVRSLPLKAPALVHPNITGAHPKDETGSREGGGGELAGSQNVQILSSHCTTIPQIGGVQCSLRRAGREGPGGFP